MERKNRRQKACNKPKLNWKRKRKIKTEDEIKEEISIFIKKHSWVQHPTSNIQYPVSGTIFMLFFIPLIFGSGYCPLFCIEWFPVAILPNAITVVSARTIRKKDSTNNKKSENSNNSIINRNEIFSITMNKVFVTVSQGSILEQRYQ